MRTLRRAVFVLGSLCSAFSLEAQSPVVVVPVPPGARIRVRAPQLVAPLIANYLETRGDTVVLVEDRAGQGLWSIPYDDIRTLELSIGQKKNHAPYIVRGAMLGGGAGFVLGLLAASTLKPSDSGRKYKRVTTGALFAVGGAAIGAAVGSRFSTENWSPVALKRRITLAPTARGAELRVSLQF